METGTTEKKKLLREREEEGVPKKER